MLKDRWGSRSVRLSKENMRALNACYLCLETAQHPVCCLEGHLYCKVRASRLTQECILTDLVHQKSALAQYAKKRAARATVEANAAETRRAEAEAERRAAFVRDEGPMHKRKHAEEDEAPPRKRAGASSDRGMPAFWLPSMAPEVAHDAAHDDADTEAPRASTTLCTAAADKPHKLLSKHLVPVRFSTRHIDGGEQMYCPCCMKEYTSVARTHGTLRLLIQSCAHAGMCCVRPAHRRSLPSRRPGARPMWRARSAASASRSGAT